MGDEVLKQAGRFSDWIKDAIQTLYPLAKGDRDALDDFYLLAACAQAYLDVVKLTHWRQLALEQLDGIEFHIGRSREDGGKYIEAWFLKMCGLPAEDEDEDEGVSSDGRDG